MKGLLTAIAVLFAIVAVDEIYNDGIYTGAALSMVREMQRSFGF
jgi:hypothetical protein